MNQMRAGSYSRAVRLAKAGCVLPYIDTLPGKAHFHQRGLFVEQISEYHESHAFDLGGATGYAIVLRVGTERSRGAIVTNFDFTPPWPDHFIDWDCYPEHVIAKGLIKRYERLLESRLPAILHERRKLYRGIPVEGLLYGKAWAPIPPSPRREGPALAEITLVDDYGMRASCLIRLSVYNAAPRPGQVRDRTTSEDLQNVRNCR